MLHCSFVGKFVPRKEREKQLGTSQRFTNIYVKNFGDDFTETMLKELFLPYGNIVSQRVMLDEEGRARGFGFVSFDSHDSAAKVNVHSTGLLNYITLLRLWMT